jgi:tetratricopeptide (TPR) repeat protein
MEFFIFLVPIILNYIISGDFKKQLPEDYSGKEEFQEGVLLFESEKIAEAFNYFSLEAQRKPKSAFVLLYLAKCHIYFENYLEAFLALEKSQRINNEIRETYFLIALVEYELENYQNSMKAFKKASRIYLEKNPEILRYLGELNLKFGNFVEARKNLKIALELGDTKAENMLKEYF